jgi:hypothetical protein
MATSFYKLEREWFIYDAGNLPGGVKNRTWQIN